jgi:hypothetical protein
MMNLNTFVQKDANKLKDLIEILTWCRGAGTQSEKDFVAQHIATIDGIWPDDYGNYHLTIGKEPQILWSCHTDTVTRKEGKQNVKWLGKGWLGLNNGQSGQCLGADDGAGLWIMLELIKAGKEGHYVFHRDEEIGGLGSTWISKNLYVLPSGLKAAIAMDRCGTEDIITHQMYQRTCSDAFADSLAAQLPSQMRKDDGGVFTDTANYVDVIGECTNLACGYERNHGKDEVLDTKHLRELRDALLVLDISKLEYSRNPGEYEYADWYGASRGSYGGVTDWYPSNRGVTTVGAEDEELWDNYHGETEYPLESGGEPTVSMLDMVNEAPEVAARLIEELGVTRDEFRAHVFALTGKLLGA